MALLIKGVSLPKTTMSYVIRNDGTAVDRHSIKQYEVVEIPDEHGDIVDLQKLFKYLAEHVKEVDIEYLVHTIAFLAAVHESRILKGTKYER